VPSGILGSLGQIYGRPQLRVLVTSGVEPDISRRMDHFQKFKIRPADTKSDLLTYIIKSVRALPGLDEAKIASTIITLSKKASGLFIWVRLVVDLLGDAATSSEFDEIFATVPRGLHQIYCLAIERLRRRLLSAPSSGKRMARHVLRWLSLAPKPLLMEEIREAVAVAALHEASSAGSSNQSIPLSSLRPSSQAILDVCGTIVNQDESKRMIRLLHHTAREFLTNVHDEWEMTEVV